MIGRYSLRSSITDLWIRTRSSYWFVPLLLVLSAVALSLVMVEIDSIL